MVVFKDREEAGKKLAKTLLKYKARNPCVLAIPRGGVPVGWQVANKLKATFDVLVTRKIPIPFNPEAGFGAVTVDKTIILNKELVSHLGLSEEKIRLLAEKVWREIRRREKVYRGNRPKPNLLGKTVILVDDGLASGFTMLAAIESVRKAKPEKVAVAVPVTSGSAAGKIKPKVSELVSLYTHPAWLPFAVASFYQKWTELTDEEVKRYLETNVTPER